MRPYEVMIIFDAGLEEESIRAELEDPVLPGDIVVVPESFF